jgi:hypothetical protein
MRKLTTYTLTGRNTNAVIRRGDYRVQKGQNAPAMRAKVRMQLKNITAGALALSAAQRETLLDLFDVTLEYGAAKQNKPYSNTPLSRIRELARMFGLSEMAGFNDSVKGLARNIAAGATVDVEFTARIPTGLFSLDPALRDLVGVGPTQAASFQGMIRRGTDSEKLPAGVELVGNVFVDLMAEERPCKYDRWAQLPVYDEWTEMNRITTTKAGLCLLLAERSAAHAASVLTDVGLSVDGLSLYDKVSVQDFLAQYLDTPSFPADGLITSRLTLLYAVAPGTAVADLPTGRVRFEQYTHALNPMQLLSYVIPTADEAALAADAAYIANAKGRRVTLTYLPGLLGVDVPKALMPFMPFAVLDDDDREVEQWPGLRCEAGEGKTPQAHVPRSAAMGVAARIRGKESAGEYLNAKDELHQLSKHVPGALTGTRGFAKNSSSVFDQIRSNLNRVG